MKNYIIGILAVAVLVIGSFYYKSTLNDIYNGFPQVDIQTKTDVENPFYLYYFFSSKNCGDCLRVTEVLNHLPEQFVVIGVVADYDFRDKAALRKNTGANFEIISFRDFKKYIPPYWPSIIGVDKNRKIYFILPCVPGEKEYLESFVSSFYERAYSMFLERN